MNEQTYPWYMVNKDGVATLCADQADAEKEAKDAQAVWPHMGPHRAVQLRESAGAWFTAADMATAAAQGFREGQAAELAAMRAGGGPVAWAWNHSRAPENEAPQPSPTPQADSQPAPQGETNVQLDTDSNHSAPGQQRDVAGSVALGQPVGNGSDQAAGHTGAQGDKLLIVAERNIRSFLRSAVFKSESDREAALNCVDVLWEAARAPADSVLEDAARWQMAVLIGNEVMLHPEKRTHPAAVKAYMDAVHSGLDLTGAVDAARKQGGA